MDQKPQITEQEVIAQLRRAQQEKLRRLNKRVSMISLLVCAVFLAIIILRTL